jgi:hypothetical protein
MIGLEDVVFAVALLVMAGCSVYFAPRIRVERVPMQWGFDGKPTWYAPRLVGLWGPLVFVSGVRLLIAALEYFVPDKVHHVTLGILGLSVVMAVAHAWHLRAVARWAAHAHGA